MERGRGLKGLELSRKFYEELVRPMLEKDFSGLLPYLAAGLSGSGSECLGYDDEASADHDFEPGVCIFLPGEDVVSRRDAFLLERAYDKLPREFMGFRRSLLPPAGAARRGVIRTSDFFLDKTGTPDGELSPEEWLSLDEQYLLEATNGEIFFDGYGEVTRIRGTLSMLPEDIRLKKMAGALFLMGQAGSYNYPRCIAHHEPAAAQLALSEYVRSALHLGHLMAGRYMPYYKWAFRSFRELIGHPAHQAFADTLEKLLLTGNSPEEAEEKTAVLRKIEEETAEILRMRGFISPGTCFEKAPFELNDRVRDPGIRNLDILAGV
ncbi:MAG: DUF4037 domain-containing protein [Lachnospiraceae bacterium]|nr:DUF4037 domain-containing protein [Lachnospiraceae bacterium]